MKILWLVLSMLWAGYSLGLAVEKIPIEKLPLRYLFLTVWTVILVASVPVIWSVWNILQ